MENASKALLIAGSMLLVVLVLTFAIYLFTRMAGQTSEFYSEMSENEIAEFNQKYFKYDKRNDLTIQDVVTIINLAKNDNQQGKMPVTISVTLNGNDVLVKDINTLLEDSEGKYTCKVEYANNSKLVGKITIT